MVAASRQRNESRSWSYGTRRSRLKRSSGSVGMRVPRRRQLSQSALFDDRAVRKVAQNRNPCLEQMCHFDQNGWCLRARLDFKEI